MGSGSSTSTTLSGALTPAEKRSLALRLDSVMLPWGPEPASLQSILQMKSSTSFDRRRCESQQRAALQQDIAQPAPPERHSIVASGGSAFSETSQFPRVG